MRNLGVRLPPVGLLSDGLRASRLHGHLHSQRGFVHLHTLHLIAGQALPPRSSSYLGAQTPPCARQCKCATCTSWQVPVYCCAAGLPDDVAVARAIQLCGCLGDVVLHLDGEDTVSPPLCLPCNAADCAAIELRGRLAQWGNLCTLVLAWRVCPAGHGSLDGEAQNVLSAMFCEMKLAHTKARQKPQPPPRAEQPSGTRQALRPQAAAQTHRPPAAPTRGMSGKCCAAPVPAAPLSGIDLLPQPEACQASVVRLLSLRHPFQASTCCPNQRHVRQVLRGSCPCGTPFRRPPAAPTRGMSGKCCAAPVPAAPLLGGRTASQSCLARRCNANS